MQFFLYSLGTLFVFIVALFLFATGMYLLENDKPQYGRLDVLLAYVAIIVACSLAAGIGYFWYALPNIPVWMQS